MGLSPPPLDLQTHPIDCLSSSRCTEKPTGWSKVFRFCEHAQDVYSCHAALQLHHTLLAPAPHPRLQLRQFSSNQRPLISQNVAGT